MKLFETKSYRFIVEGKLTSQQEELFEKIDQSKSS